MARATVMSSIARHLVSSPNHGRVQVAREQRTDIQTGMGEQVGSARDAARLAAVGYTTIRR